MKTIGDILSRQFPVDCWKKHRTPKAELVRRALMHGFAGKDATRVALCAENLIGPDIVGNEISVSIPFRTRSGNVVTLYGGHIHATKHITWDVIGETPWGDIGDYEDDRFPEGLACLRTVEIVRIIRTL